MLLGIPFHLSLIYSTHNWAVNSVTTSLSLTLFNDFIHAFRMQVFFVISGYFSLMLYQRYEHTQWLKIRLERVVIPLLSSVVLITVPQFFMLKKYTDQFNDWVVLNSYQKFNAMVWGLVSHLWFLLTLALLTGLCYLLFNKIKALRSHAASWTGDKQISLLGLCGVFLVYGIVYCAARRLMLIYQPEVLGSGLFNFVVMETLFYLPFFILGAYVFNNANLKNMFLQISPPAMVGSALLYAAYLANQHLNDYQPSQFGLDVLIKMLMGVLMTNVVFSLSYRLLNHYSASVTYLVNASLFIYLVHHPLTLLYGAFITPRIHSNILGFLGGMVFVFSIALLLYEGHKRVPLLRFLFSGKPSTQRN